MSTRKRNNSESCNTKSPKKLKKYFSENKLKEISSIFLSNRKHSNILIDLLEQFHKPTETPVACVNAVENVFAEVLKRKDMTVTESDNEAERQYKEWLAGCYEDGLQNVALCLQKGTSECKLQALNTLMKLLSLEANYPISKNKKKKKKNNFPIRRLQVILQALYSSKSLSQNVLDRLAEYLEYKDLHCNIWLALEGLVKDAMKEQPVDTSVWNMLLVLSKLPKRKRSSDPDVQFCDVKNVIPEDRTMRAAVTELWKHLSRWHYSPRTHQLLLIILVEHMMPLMENAIFLTDYFMDALDRSECEINMLALQGIFNLVIKHNIEYPDIYGKLYQLFSEESLKAKYKERLFALADDFLRSTHLPLALVAAFAKRFSRLLLSSTLPDLLILLTFIANLLIRHPDLGFLCHSENPHSKGVNEDPYLEDEKDPVKSNASQSQLWEVSLLQHHYSDRVTRLATSIVNHDLPSVEYQLDHLLDLTWFQTISKDINILKKKIPKVLEKFDEKPMSSKMEEARQTEMKIMFADLTKLFVLS